jgi:hypothetical protein
MVSENKNSIMWLYDSSMVTSTINTEENVYIMTLKQKPEGQGRWQGHPHISFKNGMSQQKESPHPHPPFLLFVKVYEEFWSAFAWRRNKFFAVCAIFPRLSSA